MLSEFAAMDSDGDGQVTLDQATKYHESLFSQNDKNGDGSLDATELPPIVVPQNSSPEAVVARFDRDRNKKLTVQEFVVRVNTVYAHDLNGDGTLTREEFLSAPRAAPAISDSSSSPSSAPDTSGKQGNRGNR